MKILIKMIVLISFLSIIIFCQNQFYWKDAPANGTKIYLIKFFDSNNGVAKSQFEETLVTNDGGQSWSPSARTQKKKEPASYLWSAEIYCSVMRTNDGGTTWVPYLQEPQEHFCMVYFKDNNTGWKVAEEFLSKVVNTINTYINNDNIKSLVDQPHQCTEYYTNVDSGWALGWCVRSFENQ
jgi:photosystem II stability/assembly factor-like uncharacterized protein